jgi:replicative DNA helicase
VTVVDLGDPLATALWLAGRGWYLHPLDHPSLPVCAGVRTSGHVPTGCVERGKHPAAPHWTQAATTDEAQIRQWFCGEPRNIGIACGPSRLLVVDEDAQEEFARYADSINETIPTTFTVRTGKGFHYYFEAPAGLALGNGEGAFASFAINIRGQGGYVVAPGSLHASGARYDAQDITATVLGAPGWVVDAIKPHNRKTTYHHETLDQGGVSSSGPIPHGRRDSTMYSYACRLRQSGLSLAEAMPVMHQRWQDVVQPPEAPDDYPWSSAMEKLHRAYATYPPGRDLPLDGGATILSDFDAVRPIPLRLPRVRRAFPTGALPTSVAAMVEAVAEFTQTPADLPGTVALAVLAACAGGRAVVEVRPGWREPVNLFVVVAMPPGSRKSPVFATMTAPLLDVELELTESAKDTILEAKTTRAIAEKRAKASMSQAGDSHGAEGARLQREAVKAALEAESIVVPTMPRLLADNITPEAVASLLAEQGGRIAILSAEGGIFDIVAGRYSGGIPDMDVWLKGHAGDPLRIDRKGREPERILSPALTVGLAVQPKVLTTIGKNAAFAGRGLLARFLYSLPANNVGSRRVGSPSVPAEATDAYAAAIHDLGMAMQAWHDPAVLTLTPGADELCLDLERQVEPRLGPDGDLYPMADWGSKLTGATIRMAALIHLANDPSLGWQTSITEDELQAAAQLADYFTDHAKVAFDLMGADQGLDDAEYVLDHLKRRGLPEFTVRNLFTDLPRGRFGKVKEFGPTLDLLEAHDWIRRLPDPPITRAGRPSSPTYVAHPELFVAEPAQSAELVKGPRPDVDLAAGIADSADTAAQ